jgi:hypothetical protein
MIAGVYREDMAVATGSECDGRPAPMETFEFRCITAVTYLFRTTGQVLGVSLSGAVLQSVLLRKLRQRITGPGSLEVSGIHATYTNCAHPYDVPLTRSSRRYGMKSDGNAANILTFYLLLDIQ